MGFLYTLIDSVFPPRDSEILVRTAQESALVSLVAPTVVRLTEGGVTTLLPYDHALVQACVLEAKFHGTTRAYKMLARAFYRYMQTYVELLHTNDVKHRKVQLLPIPLSKQRRRERGYNQVQRMLLSLPELVPQKVSIRELILVRTRHTKAQTTLGGAERRQNLKNAFGVSNPSLISLSPSDIYIVVDDVVTTGATLGSAMAALRAAGCNHVYGLALAHSA